MDKQKYIDYLNDTSAKVSPFILEILQQYAELDAELYDGIMFFVSRRLGRPLLKPALLRATYELCGGEDWEKIIPACAAFELINISSYQANATFDNKLGILSKKQQDMQFIAAMSTREVAEDCVRLMRNSFDESVLARISECLSVSNKYIYIAQHWDINLLTVANAERFADYEYFLKEYTRRCHFGSGIFSGQCAYAGAMLSGASGEQLEALKSFGEAYGTALHMINDLGDLVPCAGGEGRIRDYQDFFSDLRNGRLTLPLYLLRRATDDSGSALTWLTKVDSASDQRFRELPALLVQTGTSNVIKALVSTKMQDAIDVLDVFRGSASYGVIRAMSSVVRTNKYFARLRLL